MNYDKIYIRDLALRCIIGFNDEERREKQDVLINIVLYVDIKKACRSDRVEDSINYKTVKKQVIALVEQSSYNLVEKLAEEIAVVCLKYPGVNKVKVTVDKPMALRFSRSVAVEIMRGGEQDDSHDA